MNSYPENAINEYVWEQFRLDSLKAASASYLGGFKYSQYNGIVPFFPVSDNVSGSTKWKDKTYVIYDSFATKKPYKGLYPVKSSQMMYSIRGSLEDIYLWRDFITNVLDREDVAGNEISEYAGANMSNVNFRFHCINVFQNNYIGNSTESSGVTKTYSTNLVIKYDYHITNVYNNGI